MLTTATHDHKRGEDVRARLAVLSELAGEWSQAVERWLELAAPAAMRLIGTRMPSTAVISQFYFRQSWALGRSR